MRLILLTFFPLLLLCTPARAEITEQQLQADCAKVPTYASQGEQFYKARNYAKAREAFEKTGDLERRLSA